MKALLARMRATKRALGPLDKRKRITRCQSCSARRIKCEGGIPCKYCVRTGKDCLPQTSIHNEIKFIAVMELAQPPSATGLPSQLSRTDDNVYLDLFAAFIRRCQFTSGFVSVNTDLVPLIYSSPLLYDVAVATGALEASRRGSCGQFYGPKTARYIAFRSYDRAINTLRSRLATTEAFQSEDVLWSTFLFGLFELISETSGERWAKHMFYGTSRMLKLAGPTRSSTSLRQKLFDAFRVLEANRAILFGDDTFLSQPVWLLNQPNLAARRGVLWDSMETILLLKIQVASFSKRFFDQIESIPQPLRPSHRTIQALAQEGVEISRRLCDWHHKYMKNSTSGDAYTQVARVDFHALVLFLSQSYTYYACWGDQEIPLLTNDCVDGHITAILELAGQIHSMPNIPGVIILFALRMAGAHATDAEQRSKVVNTLAQIYQEGFIVSERIKRDVQDLWQHPLRENNP